MNHTRMNHVCEQIKAANLDGLLICPSEELLFLTGFSPKMCERFQGLFLNADGRYFYFCNLLYLGEVHQAYGNEIKIHT